MAVDTAIMNELYTKLGVSSTEAEPTAMSEETISVLEKPTPPGTPSVAMSEPRPERSLLERAGRYIPPELRELGRSIGETYLGQEFQDRPVQTTLEMVGPGADINVMKEASAEVIPKFMEGDILGSITELSIATVSPFLSLLPFASMGGIRKVINKKNPTITESKALDEIGEATQTIRTGNIEPPANTTKAYKLFNIDETGNLHPLYIKHGEGAPLPLNKWIKAEAGEINPETGKVVGQGINDLAYRPGFHSGDLPIATHIGGKIDPKTGKRVKGKQPVNIREDNQVWAEVEVGNDIDWQSVANSRASIVKSGPRKGKLNTQQAQIQDQIPKGGHYRYKTNPNMTGNWLISGEVKINKVLNDAEVKQINDAAGVADLPRISEFLKRKEDIPTRWYRGTTNIGESSSPAKWKTGKEGVLGGGGIYVTPDPKYASRLATENVYGDPITGGFVTPLDVTFKNPLVVSVSKTGQPEIKILENLGISAKKAEDMVEKAYEIKGGFTTEIKNRAIKQGYDGIILKRDGIIQEAISYKPEKNIISAITKKKQGGSIVERNPHTYNMRAI